MNYAEALEYLYGLQRFGARFGLETTRRLAEAAGSPERSLRFIHVAGTNGKGSTCAFLESICRRMGLRTGLYTSPHLVSFRERIQVNRQWIPEADVARLVGMGRIWSGDPEGGDPPTFFEFVTVMALHWFAEAQCDIVLWETGLGGRLDSTNVVMPLASVITNIGWDHMQWLGPTLAAIASEKAGIIKEGVPVFTSAVEAEALAVIRQVAAECRAPLRVVGLDDPEATLARQARLPLLGAHQVLNAALAAATARVLGADDGTIRSGLEQACWPGRFQVLRQGARTIVLDGAHNPPAGAALAAALESEFPGRPYALVFGMLADKDQRGAAAALVPGASKVLVVPIHANRGGDPSVLAAVCGELSAGRPVGQAKDLAAALAELANEELVVVTGSLYLVGEALELIAGSKLNERGLNDWSPIR